MELDESQILVGIIGAIGAVLAASVPYYFIKKNEMEVKIKEIKLQRYDDLLKRLTIFLESPTEDMKSLGAFIMAYNRASSYASKTVLDACKEYLKSSDLQSMKIRQEGKGLPHANVALKWINATEQISNIFIAIREDVNPKETSSSFFSAFTIEQFERNLSKNTSS